MKDKIVSVLTVINFLLLLVGLGFFGYLYYPSLFPDKDRAKKIDEIRSSWNAITEESKSRLSWISYLKLGSFQPCAAFSHYDEVVELKNALLGDDNIFPEEVGIFSSDIERTFQAAVNSAAEVLAFYIFYPQEIKCPSAQFNTEIDLSDPFAIASLYSNLISSTNSRPLISSTEIRKKLLEHAKKEVARLRPIRADDAKALRRISILVSWFSAGDLGLSPKEFSMVSKYNNDETPRKKPQRGV